MSRIAAAVDSGVAVMRDRLAHARREFERVQEVRRDVDARPLADPQHRGEAAVVTQVVPMLLEGDRPSRSQVLADAGAVELRPPGRVVGTADHAGKVGWAQP